MTKISKYYKWIGQWNHNTFSEYDRDKLQRVQNTLSNITNIEVVFYRWKVQGCQNTLSKYDRNVMNISVNMTGMQR